jgi:hypothetical protein
MLTELFILRKEIKKTMADVRETKDRIKKKIRGNTDISNGNNNSVLTLLMEIA